MARGGSGRVGTWCTLRCFYSWHRQWRYCPCGRMAWRRCGIWRAGWRPIVIVIRRVELAELNGFSSHSDDDRSRLRVEADDGRRTDLNVDN